MSHSDSYFPHNSVWSRCLKAVWKIRRTSGDLARIPGLPPADHVTLANPELLRSHLQKGESVPHDPEGLLYSNIPWALLRPSKWLRTLPFRTWNAPLRNIFQTCLYYLGYFYFSVMSFFSASLHSCRFCDAGVSHMLGWLCPGLHIGLRCLQTHSPGIELSIIWCSHTLWL